MTKPVDVDVAYPVVTFAERQDWIWDWNNRLLLAIGSAYPGPVRLPGRGDAP